MEIKDHVIGAFSPNLHRQPWLLTVLMEVLWDQVNIGCAVGVVSSIPGMCAHVVPGVIGTLQAMEALKIAAGSDSILSTVHITFLIM